MEAENITSFSMGRRLEKLYKLKILDYYLKHRQGTTSVNFITRRVLQVTFPLQRKAGGLCKPHR